MRFLACVIFLGGAIAGFGKLTPEQVRQLPPPASHQIDFTKEVKPIFEASCINCHARGKVKGGFNLETRENTLKGGDSGPSFEIGKSGESLLIAMVSGLDPEIIMPQKGSKLTPSQVGILRAWIDQGAKWDPAVSFAKRPPVNFHPRNPKVPPVAEKNPIDAFLAGYYQENKVKASELVNDRLFVRRVNLDLIGLLPSFEEIQKFEKDTRPNKRELLVKEVLGRNKDYTEHWLSFWNDALRNDYRGTGYIDGGRKQISAWLYAALEQNKPYDQFVRELIDPKPEAEGFTKGIVWRGVVNASQTPPIQAAQNISQVFMGVNLKCASCHDSFINDWTLSDAYSLANIYSNEPLELFECDKPIGQKAGMRFIYPELGDIDGTADKKTRLQQLAKVMTSQKNGRLTRTMVNRLWARLMGRGLVEPVDEMDHPAWSTELLDFLAEDFAANGHDVKRTLALIATSKAYQLPSQDFDETSREKFVFKGPIVKRLTAEQFRDAVGTLTGYWYEKPAGEFDFASAFPNLRLGKMPVAGRWIWNDTNAATAAPAGTAYFHKAVQIPVVPTTAYLLGTADNKLAVYVNGTRVMSVTDFTKPGFVNIAQHLKKGENIIALVATNDVSQSAGNPAGLFVYAFVRAANSDGTEAIMDFASDHTWHTSSNQIDKTWRTAAKAPADWTMAADLGGPALNPWKLESSLDRLLAGIPNFGRTRAALVAADSLMVALGRPNREQVITSRPPVATTLQCLELTNGEALTKLLKQGAEKLAAKHSEPTQLVRQIYWTALSREPSSPELELGRELIGHPVKSAGVEDMLWAVAMLPEFQLVY